MVATGHYKWLLSVMAPIAIVLVGLTSIAEERVSVSMPQKGFTYRISRGAKEVMTLDVARFLPAGADILRPDAPELHPVSPDGDYIPFIIKLGQGNADVLLLDVKRKSLERRALAREWFPSRYARVEWVTSRTLSVKGRMGSPCFLYRIDSDTSQMLQEVWFIAWDAQGENYISCFDKVGLYDRWMGSLPNSPIIADERLIVSEAVRYNGYWVYPKPLGGFVTNEEYAKWRSDIGVRESGKGSEQPPIIRTRGVAVDRNHVLTPPVFVANTTWAAFFEVVFPLGRYDVIQECNAVLLDAHRVHTNPPMSADISIKKQAIPQVVDTPTTKAQFRDLAINIYVRWNGLSGSLEFWKTEGAFTKDRAKKLGEIPIDLARMEFGQWKTEQSDWISLNPSVPASEFSSQKQSQNR